jgi:hypothetical protein
LKQLRPLPDQTLSILFSDLIKIKSEGKSEFENDRHRLGRTKEGGVRRWRPNRNENVTRKLLTFRPVSPNVRSRGGGLLRQTGE